MAKLGGGINELQVDLLQSATARLHQQRLRKKTRNQFGGFQMLKVEASRATLTSSHLPQRQNSLLGSHHAALHHDKVVGHLPVVNEPSLKQLIPN